MNDETTTASVRTGAEVAERFRGISATDDYL